MQEMHDAGIYHGDQGNAMATNTAIEERLKGVIERLAPNQTARYNVLTTETGIARHKWVNWLNGRQGLSIEMLDAYVRAWPEYAIWVATGQGIPPQLRPMLLGEVTLKRDGDGNAITNVPHVVSRHNKGNPPNYEWGYAGTGPRELAMNILYHYGIEEPEADYFSRHFVDDILGRIERKTGGNISEQVIQEWIEKMSPEIEKYADERRTQEQIRAKHEADLRAELAAFKNQKK